MFSNNCFKQYISIFIASVLLFITFSVNGSATSMAWYKYAQYIPEETPISKRHLRGAWISTVINLDWPSAETKEIENDEEHIQKTKDELIAILDRSVEMNINAVFFQVSPEGDAFYKSDIVNWSRYLTRTYGKDPGFDPLGFAIEESHKRNLEIHAWFNPYRVSMNTNDSTIQSLNIDKSVYKEHPEWIRNVKSRFVVDPGIPEARDWVKKRVMEVVNNYDIDGIHFDDYFYYESYVGELDDKETYKKYNFGQFSDIGDWRRNNTYLLVKELSNEISTAKPWVKFGISPAGVWGNKKDGHPEGSNTSAGLPNYDKSFADTKKWVEEEIIDYIAPQVYFTFENSSAPYGEVASWWSDVIKEKNVHLYMGQALYKINDNYDQYFNGDNTLEEFPRQLKFNVKKPEVKGSIMFRFQNFNDTNKQQVINMMKDDLWATKTLVPVMPWKGGKAPQKPTEGKAEFLHNGIKLSWADEDEDTAYYGIYRMKNASKASGVFDENNVELMATVRKSDNSIQEFIDYEGSFNEEVYIVTALDRLHNESQELVISTVKQRTVPSHK